MKAFECVQSIGGDMQFTIIRPGGLKTQPATGRGVLTEDVNVCGAIHREDVADLLVHALFSDKASNKVRTPFGMRGLTRKVYDASGVSCSITSSAGVCAYIAGPSVCTYTELVTVHVLIGLTTV